MRIMDMLRKDLKIILSDRKALAIIIFMPIILSTILSFALGGSFMDMNEGNISKFHLAIVKKYDMDKDIDNINNSLTNGLIGENLNYNESNDLIKAAKELNIEELFFDKFLGNNKLKKIIDYRVEDEETAMKLLKNKKIAGVVILPENFVYDMTINFITPFRNKVSINVIGNPEYAMGLQVVEGVMSGFTDKISSIIIGKNVFLETALEEGIEKTVFEDMGIIVKEIEKSIEDIGANIGYIQLEGKKSISSFDYYAAAMATMFMLFAAGYGSRTLLEEKDNITYQRMIIAGTSKWKIAAGKFFMVFIFSLLQMTIMIFYSSLLFKVNWGNLGLVVIISLCTMFAVAGLGTMIAAATLKAGNYKMSMVFDNIVIQVMALIGGSFVPFEMLPKFMQKLSILSINGIALKSYLKSMMGYGIGEVKIYLLVLLGLGIVFNSMAVYILKWKDGAKYV
jgi:ABC-2 type transport system permease protein